MRMAVLLLLALLAFCFPALASEGHGAEFKPLQLIGAIVNFVIFVWIIVHFGKKGIKSYYDNRARELRAAVVKAEEQLARARRAHSEVFSRHEGLERETKEIVEGARNRAHEQSGQIVEDARHAGERRIRDAEQTMEAEIARAKDTLKANLVDSALAIAESEITRRLDPDIQKRLIDNYLENLEEAG